MSVPTSPIPNAEADELGPGDEFDPIDDEFAPRAKQKLGRSSAALAAALAIGLGFLGGVYIEKHHATATTATTARANFAAARGIGARAYGEAGGFEQAPTAGAAGAPSAATPAVIGSVVSLRGSTLVVKNLGGIGVTVHLTATTALSTTAVGGALRAGQTVAVRGTVAPDKSVTATSITVQ